MYGFVKTSSFCMALLGFALGFPSAASAQSVAEPNSVTVTPFLSGTFGTSNDLGGSLGIGAGVGYDLTRNLGFEAEISRAFDVAGDDDNLDWALTNFSANVLYHFDVPRVTPYATFGVGWERSSPDFETTDVARDPNTEIAWNVGAGVKVPLTPRFLARGDIRRFQANDLAPDHWRVYAGLTFWIRR